MLTMRERNVFDLTVGCTGHTGDRPSRQSTVINFASRLVLLCTCTRGLRYPLIVPSTGPPKLSGGAFAEKLMESFQARIERIAHYLT
jgi:hypothetical protein